MAQIAVYNIIYWFYILHFSIYSPYFI